MIRKELVTETVNKLREKNVRKRVRQPRQVFHISDNDGNKKDFVVKQSDKQVLFTSDDVDAILESFLDVIKESLQKGESVTIRDFGTIGLKYRQPRGTKIPGTDQWVDVVGRYVPKFTFASGLRMAAKLYELSLDEHLNGTQGKYDNYYEDDLDEDIDTPEEVMEDAD